ncbi:Hypothetical Protein FCC1311_076632 [Hondaea fermentalgiana]|uniref:Nickel insertion protein n=1 Tax=Hondaea fermentalgiana TaxID=2315210 RepID=A0A2R5GMA5_9STRA|nr:Hypothetical Protein FCC1311_076632 [Hondaea fermentalgiana]|eukprot:GBG31439.1 Hypothetical Protein FCC1311_076632 [Hondaea fermentalgiana]
MGDHASKKIAYVDCFAGAAGDMLLGALVDAGLDILALEAKLKSMTPVADQWALRATRVHKSAGAIAAVQVHVDVLTEQLQERNLDDVREIIESGHELPRIVKDKALAAFEALAQAEAHVHGTTVEHIHFHEVGAIDSIIDTVGVVMGLHMLGVEKLYCSSIPMAQGYVRAAHGLLPVPAPATLRLLQNGFVVHKAPDEMRGELVTPTAASLLSVLADPGSLGSYPDCRWSIETSGAGAGTREREAYPNIVRVMIGIPPTAAKAHGGEDTVESERAIRARGAGETATDAKEVSKASQVPGSRGKSVNPSGTQDTELVVMECNIDDMTGELAGHLIAELLRGGALDAWYTNILMKKNRPALTLSVLCPPQLEETLILQILRETPTLGVRRHRVRRFACPRLMREVETSFGTVRVKLALSPVNTGQNGAVAGAKPEFDDCVALAARHAVPVKLVLAAAHAALPASWSLPHRFTARLSKGVSFAEEDVEGEGQDSSQDYYHYPVDDDNDDDGDDDDDDSKSDDGDAKLDVEGRKGCRNVKMDDARQCLLARGQKRVPRGLYKSALGGHWRA